MSFQSFIDPALARFPPGSFYLLDQPEAALPFHGCLRMLRIVHDTVLGGGQFMIGTHSPVVLAHPEATIVPLSEDGIDERHYDDVDSARKRPSRGIPATALPSSACRRGAC